MQNNTLKYHVPLAMILTLILSACGAPAAPPTPTPPPEPVEAAVSTFSRQAGIPMDEISIISYEETEWPNACLGFAEAEEMCAQVITPGWQVMVDAGGQEYEIRSDTAANVVRYQSDGEAGEASNPDSLY